MKNYHITKDSDGWKLKGQGAERATIRADTKVEIVQKTSVFMSDKVGSVKIHKEDGRIQEERTYQRKDDPTKSKG
jgi:hypothetical protein